MKVVSNETRLKSRAEESISGTTASEKAHWKYQHKFKAIEHDKINIIKIYKVQCPEPSIVRIVCYFRKKKPYT